ncbi:hypothetical protein [Ulvibacter antarcticus]|uniref:SpoIIAA-like protein n=1 Tax=Ulvibacter antarcticus TaxID=442714 RepID=A0A3L9ZC45_9FLAO|nr:hypothetical protein [Ulvibacter antarcticus]RMA64192.1 hypothetical protein BXY75_1062 [Ulvibacter antarcticus]
MKSTPLATLDIDFATVKIYEHYVISQIKEGIVFEKKHLAKFHEIFETYYTGKPFVSIADRKNDYTIKPNMYMEQKFPSLVGIGVICYSEASYNISLFEQKFFKGNFSAFYSLKECISWAESIITKDNSKQ